METEFDGNPFSCFWKEFEAIQSATIYVYNFVCFKFINFRSSRKVMTSSEGMLEMEMEMILGYLSCNWQTKGARAT